MRSALLSVVAVLSLVSVVNAQGYDPDALDYSFGTLKKVSATEIALEEFDFEGDLEKTIEVTYVINAETEFDNFEKIEDLTAGEDMEVYFIEADGKKTAVALAKDEGLIDLGEDMEYMGDEEMFYGDEPAEDGAAVPAQ